MKRIPSNSRDDVTILPSGFFDHEVVPERKRMKQAEGSIGVAEKQNVVVDAFLKELEEERGGKGGKGGGGEGGEGEESGGGEGDGGNEKSNNDKEEEDELGDEQVDIEAILYRARLESLKELRREGKRIDDSDELQETGGANQVSREEQKSLLSKSIKKVMNEKKKKAGVDDDNNDDDDDDDFDLQWQRKGIKVKR